MNDKNIPFKKKVSLVYFANTVFFIIVDKIFLHSKIFLKIFRLQIIFPCFLVNTFLKNQINIIKYFLLVLFVIPSPSQLNILRCTYTLHLYSQLFFESFWWATFTAICEVISRSSAAKLKVSHISMTCYMLPAFKFLFLHDTHYISYQLFQR